MEKVCRTQSLYCDCLAAAFQSVVQFITNNGVAGIKAFQFDLQKDLTGL